MKLKYSKLRGRIVEKYGSCAEFSKVLGITYVHVSRKLTGKVQFNQSDIERWCELLDIDLKEAGLYFFDYEV